MKAKTRIKPLAMLLAVAVLLSTIPSEVWSMDVDNGIGDSLGLGDSDGNALPPDSVTLKVNGLELVNPDQIEPSIAFPDGNTYGEAIAAELDASGEVEFALPDDAGQFWLFIAGLSDDIEIVDQGWQLDGGQYVKEFRRDALTRDPITVTLGQTPRPAYFHVQAIGESAEPLKGIAFELVDSTAAPFEPVVSGETNSSGWATLPLPESGDSFRLYAAVPHNYSVLGWISEGARYYFDASLSDLMQGITIVISSSDKERFSLPMRIVGPDTELRASLLRSNVSDWTGNGKHNVEGLQVSVYRVENGQRELVSDDQAFGPFVTDQFGSVRDKNGNASITFIPGEPEASNESEYLIRISGMLGKYEITGWDLDGLGYSKLYSGNELRTIGIGTVSLAQRSSASYSLSVTASDTITGAAVPATVTLKVLDLQNPSLVIAEESVQVNERGSKEWTVITSDYLYEFSITSPSPTLFLTENTVHNLDYFGVTDGLTYQGATEQDGLWTYTWLVDFRNFSSEGRYFSCDFLETSADMDVIKTFSEDYNYFGEKVYIGYASNKSQHQITWSQGQTATPGGFTEEFQGLTVLPVTHEPGRNDLLFPKEGQQIAYLLYEYLPSGAQPSGSGWVWVRDTSYYDLPEGGLSGYELYVRSAIDDVITIDPGMKKITENILNGNAEIIFGGNEGANIYGEYVKNITEAPHIDWDIEKTASPASISTERNTDYSIEYTVKFTKDPNSGQETTKQLTMKNLKATFTYDARLAKGANYVKGDLILTKLVNGVPQEVQRKPVEFLLSQGTPVGDYYRYNFLTTMVDSNYRGDGNGFVEYYTLTFVGGYYYTLDGSPLPEGAEPTKALTRPVDFSQGDAPTKTTSLPLDTSIKNFYDEFVNINSGNYKINRIEILQMGTIENPDASPAKKYTYVNPTADEQNRIINGFEFLHNAALVPGQADEIIVKYIVYFTDQSGGTIEPCGSKYDIINRAKGEKLHSNGDVGPASVTVPVTVPKYAFIRVGKFLTGTNLTTTSEGGLTFKLYNGLDQLVAQGKTKAGTNYIILTTPDSTLTENPTSITPENYPYIFKIWNLTASNLDSYYLILEDVNAKYPVLDQQGWELQPNGSYRKNGITINTTDNGDYCGPTTIRVEDRPNTGITVDKTGRGVTESNFYLYNSALSSANRLYGPFKGTTGNTISGLEYGSYTLYEVTPSKYSPGAGWALVSNSDATKIGISVPSGSSVYKKEIGRLETAGQVINEKVVNQELERLLITKTTPNGIHSTQRTFSFQVYDTANDSTPLKFRKISNNHYQYDPTGSITNIQLALTASAETPAVITIDGLSRGSYRIEELTEGLSYNGQLVYTTQPASYQHVVELDWSNSDNPSKTAAFVNRLDTGSGKISISKTTSDNNTTEWFNFKVEEVLPGGGKKRVDLSASGIQVTYTLGLGQDLDLSEGTFQLKHGGFATITGLAPGTQYTITEIDYPSYYKPDNTSKTATATKDGGNITFTNTRQAGGKITITKEADLWPASDSFVFDLYRKTGESSWEFVEAKNLNEAQKSASWIGLGWGETYRIYEKVKEPYFNRGSNWVLDTLPGGGAAYRYTTDITISSDNAVAVSAKNELTNLTVTKTLGSNGIDGTFKFTVTGSSSGLASFKKDSQGRWIYTTEPGGQSEFTFIKSGGQYTPYTFYGLPTGETFTVTETDSAGHIVSYKNNTNTVSLSTTAKSGSVEIINSRTKLTVNKAFGGNGQNSDSQVFTFQVKDSDGNPLSFIGSAYEWTYAAPGTPGAVTQLQFSKANSAVIYGLPTGETFTVEETEAGRLGYVPDSAPSVEFSASGMTRNVTITNKNETSLTISKAALANYENPPAGLTFYVRLYKLADGQGVAQKLTGSGASYTIAAGGSETPVAIKPGERLVVTGLEIGANYYVVEYADAQATVITSYKATYNGNDQPEQGAVKIESGSDSKEIVIVNTAKSASLKVKKEANSGEQGQFTLLVKDATGNTVDSADFGPGGRAFGSGELVVTGLIPGATYRVYEIAKDGTVLSHYTTTVSPALSGWNATAEDERGGTLTLKPGEEKVITFRNTRKQDGQLSVTKAMSEGSTWDLEDTFTVTLTNQKDETDSQSVTLTYGERTKTVEGLTVGATYNVVESHNEKYLSDYKVMVDGAPKTIIVAGTSKNVVITNTRRQDGSLTLTKVVEGQLSTGHEFMFTVERYDPAQDKYVFVELKQTQVNNGTVVGSGDEKGKLILRSNHFGQNRASVTISNLEYGQLYRITEAAHSQYTLIEILPSGANLTERYAEISAVGQSSTITFINKRISDGMVTVAKTVGDGVSFPAAGFEFALYRLDGTDWQPVGSQFAQDGVSAQWSGLPLDETYRIYEVGQSNVVPFEGTATWASADESNGPHPAGSGFYFAQFRLNADNKSQEFSLLNKTTSLTVNKTITGGARLGDVFTFRVIDTKTGTALTFDNSGYYTIGGQDLVSLTVVSDNGNAVVKPITLYGLPLGSYRIEEVDKNGYTDTYANETFALSASKLEHASTITNSSTAALTVKKVMVDSAESGSFTFTLYDGNNVAVKVSGSYPNYRVDPQGGATFSVPAGGTATITGVVPGVSYYVNEEIATGYNTYYSSSNTLDEQAQQGSSAAVTIENGGDRSKQITVFNRTDSEKTLLQVVKIATGEGDDKFDIVVKGRFSQEGVTSQVITFGDGFNSFGIPVKVPGVIPGETYTITEYYHGTSVSPADHYTVSYQVKENDSEYTVLDSTVAPVTGKVYTVKVDNSRKTNAQLTVTKEVDGTWDTDDTFLFTLYEGSSATTGTRVANHSSFTDANGQFRLRKNHTSVTITGLKSGVTYTVVEETSGMVKYFNATPEQNSAESTSLNFVNERLHNGHLTLTKTVSGIMDPSDIFKFRLYQYNPDKDLYEVVSFGKLTLPEGISANQDGTLTLTYDMLNNAGQTAVIAVSGLEYGQKYKVEEVYSGTKYTVTASPSGAEEKTAYVTAEEQGVAQADFVNSRAGGGQVTLNKQASRYPGAGFRFTLYMLPETADPNAADAQWEEVGTKTLTQNGSLTWEDLPLFMWYRLYEHSYDGYALTSPAWTQASPGDAKGGFYRQFKLTSQDGQSAQVFDALNETTSVTLKKVLTDRHIGNGKFRVQILSDNGAASFVNLGNNIYRYDTDSSIDYIDLAPGMQVTIQNLPLGSYTFVESDNYADGTAHEYEALYRHNGQDGNAFVLDARNATSLALEVENSSQNSGTLTIRKALEDSLEINKSFTFRLYEGSDSAKNLLKVVQSGSSGVVDMENGSETFTLKANESITFRGLIPGYTYWVAEESVDGYIPVAPISAQASSTAEITVNNQGDSNYAYLVVSKAIKENQAGGDRFGIVIEGSFADGETSKTIRFGTKDDVASEAADVPYNSEYQVGGILPGYSYKVSEIALNGELRHYRVSYAITGGTYKEDNGVPTVVTSSDGTVKVVYTNERSTRDLVLEKNLAPDVDLHEGYGFVLYEETGSTWTPVPGYDKVIVNSDSDWKAIWQNVPAGKAYRVYETDPGLYQVFGKDWEYDDSLNLYYLPFTADVMGDKDTIEQPLGVVTNKLSTLTVEKFVTQGEGAEEETFAFQVVDANRPESALFFDTKTIGDATFYVYNPDGGLQTISIRNRESVTLYGLPLGTEYKVVETTALGHDAEYIYNSSAEDTTVLFSREVLSQSVEITNTVRRMNLTVDKVISNLEEDSHSALVTDQFSFVVKHPSNGKYLTFNGKDYSGEVDGHSQATVLNLRLEESITLLGLPYLPGADAHYLIEELNADNFDIRFAPEKSGSVQSVSDSKGNLSHYVWKASNRIDNQLQPGKLFVRKSIGGLMDDTDKFYLAVEGLFYSETTKSYSSGIQRFVIDKDNVNTDLEVIGTAAGQNYRVYELPRENASLSEAINNSEVFSGDRYLVNYEVREAASHLPGETVSTLEVKNTRQTVDLTLSKEIIRKTYEGIENQETGFTFQVNFKLSGGKFLKFNSSDDGKTYSFDSIVSQQAPVLVKAGGQISLTDIPVGLDILVEEVLIGHQYEVEYWLNGNKLEGSITTGTEIELIEVRNHVANQLIIEKRILPTNLSIINNTFYFEIKAGDQIVPVRQVAGGYIVASSGDAETITRIPVTTSYDDSDRMHIGAVKIWGLSDGVEYAVSEVSIPSNYRFVSAENAEKIVFDADKTSHTAIITNRRYSSGGGRNDDDDDRDYPPDRVHATRDILTAIMDEDVPLATILEELLPKTGRRTGNALFGIALTLLGLLGLRKKDDE